MTDTVPGRGARRRAPREVRRDGRRPPSPTATRVRARLLRLQRAVEAELRARRQAAGLERVSATPVAVRRLSSFTRELPRLVDLLPAALDAARKVSAEDVAGLLRALAAFSDAQRILADRYTRGEEVVDDFGFDQEWTESLIPAVRFLYERWWRVETLGIENVPAEGRALLVSNHAGVLPYDGAMIRYACYSFLPTPRHARALIMNAFFGMPGVSWFLRRSGNTLAHPDDAERLLRRDELVLVFPEGARGTGKPWSERYRLRRFGRGGFAEVAIRTGAPIVPISVVGSEEIHPLLANITPVAKALGTPYVPVTPTFPLLGPLGLVPLPSSWVIEFHEPIPTDHLGPDAADDPSVVLQLADEVREVIQAGLYRNLERRGSIFASR